MNVITPITVLVLWTVTLDFGIQNKTWTKKENFGVGNTCTGTEKSFPEKQNRH